MHDLITVDPGTHQAGVAYFRSKLLYRAALVAAREEDPLPRRMHDMMMRAEFLHGEWNCHPGTLAIELPRAYPKTPVDPNDLVRLALVGAAIAATFPGKEIVLPTVGDWKGTVPKAKMKPRILGALSAAERELDLSNHNVLDAVGIGLWLLGRL